MSREYTGGYEHCAFKQLQHQCRDNAKDKSYGAVERMEQSTERTAPSSSTRVYFLT